MRERYAQTNPLKLSWFLMFVILRAAVGSSNTGVCSTSSIAQHGASLLQVSKGDVHKQSLAATFAVVPPVSSASLQTHVQVQSKLMRNTQTSYDGHQKGNQTPCSLMSPLPLKQDVRHDLSFENYEDSDGRCYPHLCGAGYGGWQGLFVHPPSKFAFCLIEKNACETWISSVLQPLLGRNPPGAIDFWISSTSQDIYGQQGMDSIFQDPTAIRAVFLRDPMERFVSAFLSKCFGQDRANCPVATPNFKGAVEWAMANAWNFEHLNAHWKPQASHCDLQNRIQGYNVIALMKKETFEADTNCVLRQAGLDRYVQETTPQIGGTQPKSELSVTMVLQKLFPPDIARQLIGTALHLDYDVFGFSKEPEWLAGATGEWYALDPMPFPALHTSKEADSYTETDDIVELAIRAGYPESRP